MSFWKRVFGMQKLCLKRSIGDGGAHEPAPSIWGLNRKLGEAAGRGDCGAVVSLLKNGAEVNCLHRDRWPPLFVAAANGHREMVSLLLEKGALVDCLMMEGWRPSFTESEPNSEDLVKQWLGRAGTTPLHVASWRGYRDVVALLLENGAAVNRANEDGETSLCLAVKGHPNFPSYGHRKFPTPLGCR